MSKSIKKNAFYNILKQCCNVIFPLITYPYVSRVLSSDGLGKCSFSDSIITLSMTIAALGINTYAIREGSRVRNTDEINKFSSQVFTINLIATAIVYSILFILIAFVPRLHRDSVITYILSINILTYTLSRDWINQVFEDFKYLSIRYLIFQGISLILTFVFVKGPEDYIKYAFIMLFANSGGYIASFFYSRKYVKLRVTSDIEIKKHIKPILLLFGVELAIYIYIKTDIVVLGFFRPDSEVGVYTIVSRIYIIVKRSLYAIVAVAIPRLAYYFGNNDISSYKRLLNKLSRWMMFLIVPSIVYTFSLSKEILLIIGGDEYMNGTHSLQILSVALFFAIFAQFYANGILIVLRKDKIFFISTVVAAICNIIINIIIIPLIGMNGAAITTLVAEGIILLFGVIFTKDVGVEYDKKQVLSVIVGSIGVYIISNLVKILLYGNFIRIIVSFIMACVIYIIINKIMKNKVVIELESLVFSKLKNLR